MATPVESAGGGVDATIAAMQAMAAEQRMLTLATMEVQNQMGQTKAVADINTQKNQDLRANTRPA